MSGIKEDVLFLEPDQDGLCEAAGADGVRFGGGQREAGVCVDAR